MRAGFQLAGGAMCAPNGEASCATVQLGLVLVPVKAYAVLRRSCDQINDEACCPHVLSSEQGWRTFVPAMQQQRCLGRLQQCLRLMPL